MGVKHRRVYLKQVKQNMQMHTDSFAQRPRRQPYNPEFRQQNP